MTIKVIRSLSGILNGLIDNESLYLTLDQDITVGHSKEENDLFFENFLDALKINVSIKRLEFSNTFQKFSVKYFGEILASHNTLEHLSLSDNILTSDILTSMANILFKSKSIHTLDIPPMNYIERPTDLAFNLFFEALAKNNRIASLYIAYSPFTGYWEKASFQQALKINTSIIIMDDRIADKSNLSPYLERNIGMFKQNLHALTQDDSLLTIEELLTLKNQILAVKYNTECYTSAVFRNLESKTNHSLFATSKRLIAKQIDDTRLIVRDVVSLIAEYANYSVNNYNSPRNWQNISQLLSSIEVKIDECIDERSSQHVQGPSSSSGF